MEGWTPGGKKDPNNFYALLAVFTNEPLATRRVGGMDKVSAKITYTSISGRQAINVNRGTWFKRESESIDFRVNDSHALIIAIANMPNRPRVIALYTQHHEKTPTSILHKTHIPLNMAAYTLTVQLVAEGEGMVNKEYEFALYIEQEPAFTNMYLVDLG